MPGRPGGKEMGQRLPHRRLRRALSVAAASLEAGWDRFLPYVGSAPGDSRECLGNGWPRGVLDRTRSPHSLLGFHRRTNSRNAGCADRESVKWGDWGEGAVLMRVSDERSYCESGEIRF